MRIFTHHEPDREDWSKLYKYTIIAYRLAKRIVIEVDTPEEVEDIIYTESQAVSYIITPNGLCWKSEDWREALEKERANASP